MKKYLFLTIVMVLLLSASTVFAANTDKKISSDNPAVPAKTENKLSEEEVVRLTRRVEEIRDMDKKDMTASEKRELKNELKGIKENVRQADGVVYIGVGTLLLIIILVILLV